MNWHSSADDPEAVEFGPVRDPSVTGQGEPGGLVYGTSAGALYAGALPGIAARHGQASGRPLGRSDALEPLGRLQGKRSGTSDVTVHGQEIVQGRDTGRCRARVAEPEKVATRRAPAACCWRVRRLRDVGGGEARLSVRISKVPTMIACLRAHPLSHAAAPLTPRFFSLEVAAA
jgi:hypothetical protein